MTVKKINQHKGIHKTERGASKYRLVCFCNLLLNGYTCKKKIIVNKYYYCSQTLYFLKYITYVFKDEGK